MRFDHNEHVTGLGEHGVESLSFGFRLKGIVVKEGVRRSVIVARVAICKNHVGFLDCGDCGALR